MLSFRQPQIEAAKGFVSATIDTLETEGSVHVETAIAGIACMAGVFLFLSFDVKLGSAKAGQSILSENANDQKKQLIQILGSVLSHVGITLDKELLGKLPGIGKKPLLSFLETRRQLEPEYRPPHFGRKVSLAFGQFTSRTDLHGPKIPENSLKSR